MEDAKLLTEHYQKTYELTYEVWKGRNNTFLLLLAAIGIASLIVFPSLGTRSLFVLYIEHVVGVTDAQFQGVQSGFPFGILQALALFVIFYLMVNLYHRALYVLKGYSYLGLLETEIREVMGLTDDKISFTRESRFYWDNRDPLLGTVKWVYITLLSAVLITFEFGIAIQDSSTRDWWHLAIDALFGAPTLFYLIAYAKASIKLDRKEIPLPPIRG